MIQMINLYIFLSFAASMANADIKFSASSGLLTLSDQTDLTCCLPGQNISQCNFYANSINIGQGNSSGSCCNLTVGGQKLSQERNEKLLTAITVYCEIQDDKSISQNVTITVWKLCYSGKHVFVFVVILGTLILLSLFTFIICVIYATKIHGYRQYFPSASYTAQVMDTDNQDANSGPAEVQDEKTKKEDELLYATVNHSAAGENAVTVVTFESGTDYATVVMR